MATGEQPAATAADVLDATRELAPTIAVRAAEIETARRLPPDLLDDLRRVGCFGAAPRTHGGLGADLPEEAMRIIESLARADASVAWTVMIGAATWIDMAGLPRATFDALFATPDVITAGVFNPTGSIAVPPGATRSAGRLELRQRMRARETGCSATASRASWTGAADADGRARTRAGRDRGHLDGVRPVRHRQPPLPGRRHRRPRRADVAAPD